MISKILLLVSIYWNRIDDEKKYVYQRIESDNEENFLEKYWSIYYYEFDKPYGDSFSLKNSGASI